MKQYMLLEPCIPQRRPPDIVSGDLSVPPPTLSKHAALGHARWVEREYGSIIYDQYNHLQGVSDDSRPSAKNRGVKIKAFRQDARGNGREWIVLSTAQ